MTTWSLSPNLATPERAGQIKVVHIVLVHPQIPQNTGSVARTCAALQWPLHLIKPMGFAIDESKVKRAGLDYWPAVTLAEHETFENFIELANPGRCWFIETTGTSAPWDVTFAPNDALVFGSETKGIPPALLAQFPSEQIVRLPMRSDAVRSLNLSNTVTAVAYEALRQNAKFFL